LWSQVVGLRRRLGSNHGPGCTGRTVLWQPDHRNVRERSSSPRRSRSTTVATRRCERSFVEGLTHAEAGERCGYTRWAMVNLVRQYRAGTLELFAAPRKPGPPPGVAPAKERVRGRVIELRRQGLSTYEISAQLGREATPLNRTGVAEILAEEGFGRLLRHPTRWRARPRLPLGGTRGCHGPRGWTSRPGRRRWRPARPGCCCCCPT
jgi:hypothetical protein